MPTRTKTPFTFLRTLQVASLSLLGCGLAVSASGCMQLEPTPAQPQVDPSDPQDPNNPKPGPNPQGSSKTVEGGFLTPDPGSLNGEDDDDASSDASDADHWPSGEAEEDWPGEGSVEPDSDGEAEDGGDQEEDAGDEGAESSSGDSGSSKKDSDKKDPGKLLKEADVVHMQGDTAYVLSEYSGLHILDLSNPADIKILGSQLLDGAPFEMFIRDGVAIVMVRDQYLFDAADQSWKGASSVVRLNVADPAKVSVIDEHRVLGRVSDSRLEGNILYLVSYEDGRCYDCDSESKVRVSSLFTKKGEPLHAVDQEIFAQSERLLSAPSAYFGKDQIFVTIPKWISEVQKGTIARAHFHADTGALQALDPLLVDGRILSRWQMNQKDDVLRVFSQGTRWDIEPKLETFKLQGTDATLLAGLDVKLPEPEDIKSARFDGDRAYLITFRRTDPLFTFDLKDPSNPKQTGELEIPGWVYHMEPRGDRLIGAGYNVRNRENRLSLTLFDVSDLSAPKVLNRLEFGGRFADFAEGQDQIHKSITILDDKNMILVPYLSRLDSDDDDFPEDDESFEDESEMDDIEVGALAKDWDECDSSWESGIQIFDWDPAAIKLRGKAPVTGGAHRSFLHRDRLIALSDSSIAAYNIDDRDKPTRLSDKAIALNASLLLAMGEHTVRVSEGWRGESRRLEVVKKDAVEGLNVVSSLSLGALDRDGCDDGRDVRVRKLFAHGNHVYIMYEDWDTTYRESKVAVVSLQDPAKPKLLGSTEVITGQDKPTFALGSVRVESSVFGALGDRVIVAAVRERWNDDDRRYSLSTHFTVLRVDPTKGLVKDLEIDRDDTRYAGGLIPAGAELASWHARTTDEPGVLKFYYDRFYVDANGKVNHEAVNVPGAPIGRDSVHQRVLSMDFQLEEVDLDPASCQAHAKFRKWDWEKSRCILLQTKLAELNLPPNAPAKLVKETALVTENQTQRAVLFHKDRVFATATGAKGSIGGTRIMAGLDATGQLRVSSFDAQEPLGALTRLNDAQVMEQVNERNARVLDARSLESLGQRRYETPFRWCKSPLSRDNELQCALGRYGVRKLEAKP